MNNSNQDPSWASSCIYFKYRKLQLPPTLIQVLSYISYNIHLVGRTSIFFTGVDLLSPQFWVQKDLFHFDTFVWRQYDVNTIENCLSFWTKICCLLPRLYRITAFLLFFIINEPFPCYFTPNEQTTNMDFSSKGTLAKQHSSRT